jgi:hypothetical protein
MTAALDHRRSLVVAMLDAAREGLDRAGHTHETIDLAELDAARDTADRRTVRLAALCVLEALAGLTSRPSPASLASTSSRPAAAPPRRAG